MEIFDSLCPQVILTDFNMESLGGWPWVESLIHLCAEVGCRIVVMTGEENEKHLPVTLLKKPFTTEELQLAVTG